MSAVVIATSLARSRSAAPGLRVGRHWQVNSRCDASAAVSASMPRPAFPTVRTIGGTHPLATTAELLASTIRRQCIPHTRCRRAGSSLFSTNTSSNLHETRLCGLHLIARLRRDDDECRVGDARDVELTLTDPDGLDQHVVEAGGLEHVGSVGDGGAQAAERPRASHAANEDTCVRRRRRSSARGRRAAHRRKKGSMGSTAMTATVPVGRSARTSSVVSVDFPAPGAPVIPMRYARSGTRRFASSAAAASPPRSTIVSARAIEARSPPSTEIATIGRSRGRAHCTSTSPRSSRFRILLAGFFGRSSRNTTRFGSLKPASCARQCSISSTASCRATRRQCDGRGDAFAPRYRPQRRTQPPRGRPGAAYSTASTSLV